MNGRNAENLKELIVAEARALGFDVTGFVRAENVPDGKSALDRLVHEGLCGDMTWLGETVDRRRHPKALWRDVKSIVVVGQNYNAGTDSLAELGREDRGLISMYARSRDYHDVMKKRLKRLARWIAGEGSAEVKVFVDTAPVMEKPLAEAAGVGWQGKHSNLVSRDFGSWLFLGSVFTTLELEPDLAHEDRCGSCRACLDICPTEAFPAPYRLDPSRCISYLTIEHKGHIPFEFLPAIGNRIYGCDDCLAVCPWNKYARRAHDDAFAARPELSLPRLAELADLDDEGFREIFRGTAIKRTGRDRFVRNVMIALGNSRSPRALAAIRPRLDDESPLVRAMAAWAAGRIAPEAEFRALKDAYCADEGDGDVRRAWEEGARARLQADA